MNMMSVKQFSDKRKFGKRFKRNGKRFNSNSGSLNFKRRSHRIDLDDRGRGWNYLAESGIK